MATIIVRREHSLGLAKAKRLAEAIARRLQSEHGGSFDWRGDALRFQQPGASGSVAVTKDGFQVRVELGVLLNPLSSLIEREIVAFCDDQLSKADEPGRDQPVRRPARRSKGGKPARRSKGAKPP